MIELPPHSKISYPSMPNKEFKWSSGSDVQAIWRKHGWTPPSEKMTPPPPEKAIQPLRRVGQAAIGVLDDIQLLRQLR